MKKNYIFTINNSIRIIVSLGPCELDELCECEATMFLYCNETRYEFDMMDLSSAIESIKECMVKVLRNKSLIHTSLVGQDIGFVFNQYLYESSCEKKMPFDTQVVYDSEEEWIGVEYKAWSGYTISTWLYNSSDGKIMFEASPVYPEDFSSEDFNYQEFYEWMQSYKPLCITAISAETLQQWIETADRLLCDIEWMEGDATES